MSRGSGSTLQHEVIRQLENNPSVDACRIGVSTDGAIVTLTGRVSDAREKAMAEHLARSVDGVRAVVNCLSVAAQPAGSGDEGIAEAARSALRANRSIPADRIRVSVREGRLTLSGTVDWYFEKRCAESCVRTLAGVRGVTNEIQVRSRLQHEPRGSDRPRA